jgi:hypothetical protein
MKEKDMMIFDTLGKKHERVAEDFTARIASGTKTLWHISNERFSRFNTKMTAQGIIWFAEDADSLQKDLHGASINSRRPVYLYKCAVTMGKTAGWMEYEKYGIGELRNMGYDSIALDDDVAVLSSKSVRILEAKEIGGMKASTRVVECIEMLPPKEFDFSMGNHVPVVFLAGSIDMGAATDWQTEVVESLQDIACVALNPRRKEWDSSWKQEIGDAKFREQVEWELKGLEQADLIALNFIEDSKAPISLLELGLHAKEGKMIVCCPDGYWRKGNVEIVCARFGIELLNDFKDFKNEIRRRLQGGSKIASKVEKEYQDGGPLRNRPDYGQSDVSGDMEDRLEERLQEIASRVASRYKEC